jgi:hypothetical protein
LGGKTPPPPPPPPPPTLAVLGLPAERYLTTHDAEERLVLSALAQKAARIVNELQRNQGVHIANAMVKAKLRG